MTLISKKPNHSFVSNRSTVARPVDTDPPAAQVGRTEAEAASVTRIPSSQTAAEALDRARFSANVSLREYRVHGLLDTNRASVGDDAQTPDDRLTLLQTRVTDRAGEELDAYQGASRAEQREMIRGYREGTGGTGDQHCGQFVNSMYTEGAREAGAAFGPTAHDFQSFERARSFFVYDDFTDRSENRDANEAMRVRHAEEGSTRRFTVLEGSGGEQWARDRDWDERTQFASGPSDLDVRGGDTVLFFGDLDRDADTPDGGHVGLVESYDRGTGLLTTIEANTNANGDVQRRTYDLNDADDRARVYGFGRPALGDFNTQN